MEFEATSPGITSTSAFGGGDSKYGREIRLDIVGALCFDSSAFLGTLNTISRRTEETVRAERQLTMEGGGKRDEEARRPPGPYRRVPHPSPGQRHCGYRRAEHATDRRDPLAGLAPVSRDSSTGTPRNRRTEKGRALRYLSGWVVELMIRQEWR
jgi:hypothetical protein